ncbi:ArsI/CadI family heavy metal resistance metalloenzyme [Streptomyces sp. NPDC001667]
MVFFGEYYWDPFYSKLFGVEPAKRRPGYANFAITEPPLKLVLIEGEPGQDAHLDHLGVEVETTEQVTAATERLKEASLATFEENDTSCCYALQDKVWVHGPGHEPWEVYVVKADADNLNKSTDSTPDACCGTTSRCNLDEQAIDPSQTPTEAKAAAVQLRPSGSRAQHRRQH